MQVIWQKTSSKTSTNNMQISNSYPTHNSTISTISSSSFDDTNLDDVSSDQTNNDNSNDTSLPMSNSTNTDTSINDNNFDDYFANFGFGAPTNNTSTNNNPINNTQVNNAFSNSNKSNQETPINKLNENERNLIINEVFNLVLGRNPEDKDYQFYKYSLLTKNQLICSIVKNNQHKDLINNGINYKNLEMKYTELEREMKFLNERNLSMQTEIEVLRSFLNERKINFDISNKSQYNFEDVNSNSNRVQSKPNIVGTSNLIKKEVQYLREDEIIIDMSNLDTQIESTIFKGPWDEFLAFVKGIVYSLVHIL